MCLIYNAAEREESKREALELKRRQIIISILFDEPFGRVGAVVDEHYSGMEAMDS